MSLTDSMKRTNRKRVERGAVWLDEVDPTWFNDVDVSALKMSHECKCVIGQLVSDIKPGAEFFTVVEATWRSEATPQELLGWTMTMDQAVGRGFHFDERREWDTDYSDDADYEHLEGLWRAQIERRRGA